MGVEGASALAECLANNFSLYELNLSYACGGRDDKPHTRNSRFRRGALNPAPRLPEALTLASVDSPLRASPGRDNRVGSGGASVLLEGLEQNPSLTSVNLSDNQIGDQGAEALATVLPSMTAFAFDLWLIDNQLGDKGAAALAEALPSSMGLAGLFLASNEIGDRGAAALAQVLPTGNLCVLNLACNAISSRGAAALAHALPSSTGFSTLVLCFNQIGDDGAAAFAQVLPLATGLTQLTLNDNLISRAAKELLKGAVTSTGSRVLVEL